MNTDQLVVNLKQMQVFQNDTQILKDVNLEVKRRDFIYIIGRTGSGKSSLLKTLYGDLDFKSAEIATIASYDLNDLKPADVPMLRRKIQIYLC